MFTRPTSVGRIAPARRRLFAPFLAAFVILNPVAFIFAPAAQAQRGSVQHSDSQSIQTGAPEMGISIQAEEEEPLAPSTTVVISQVYGGAGCGTAGCSTYNRDYIELFNRGTAAQSLNGWSVQYAAQGGTSWQVTNLTNVTLQPGQYYLVAQGAGAAGTGVNTLPTADVTGTISMSATSAKVALVNTTTALTGSCPNGGATVVDFVGYGGTASTTNFCFEGSGPAPAPSTTTADIRAANGCTDTDNNSADFATGTPNPRNTSTTLAPCGGPAQSALAINDVSQDEGNSGQTAFTFTVTMAPANTTQTVTVNYATADGTATGGASCTAGVDYITTSGTLTFVANDTSEQLTVQVCGDTTSEPNETFFVNLTSATNATVTDAQGQGTIVNDEVTVTPIYEIQGSGTSSPLANGTSVTTTGVVTAKRSLGSSNNGFYIQDPSGDGNLNTSDAILIFTGSTVPTVSVGDSVRVTGAVTEFESSTTDEPDGVSPPDPKTATEIINPSIVTLSTGNSLPAPLDATSLGILNPTQTSRGGQLERYEFMRISVPTLVVSQPTNNFGEFWGVEPPRSRPFREPGIEAGDPIPPADQGPYAGTPPPAVPVWDGNFERIMVDSGAALTTGSTRRAQVQVTTGTTVTGVVGPLDYAFDQYRIVLEPNVTPGVSGGLTAAVPVPARGAPEFTVAHTNLENFTSSNAAKLNKASLAIRNVLRTPDVLGLIEVNSTASAQALASKVNTDFGDTSAVNYVAYFNDTAGTQDIGYLVNTARVTVVGSPAAHNATATFNYCGVNDTLHDRPPYILTATVPQAGGATLPFTVILNHTKSLIAVDSPRPFGTCGTGTEGARNREKRRVQAEDIADLVQTRDNAGENIVLLGDLNAFEFNDGLVDVVNTIRGVPPPPENVVEPSTDRWTFQLTNLVGMLTPSERYSFTFEGNAQVLDHVLVNSRMLARTNRFAYGRFNADFSETFAADSTRPEAVSDHDAPVAYFTTAQASATAGQIIISELRLRGPNGANDEFVEIYNNSNSDVTINAFDGSAGFSLAASDGVARFTIPNGTVIPARGHYLGVNSAGYSLASYPAGNGTTATGDATFTTDIPDNAGVALFSTSNSANFTPANRLDAAGSSSEANALYREGTGYPPLFTTFNTNYSFYRDMASGSPLDTGDNNNDFLFVDADANCALDVPGGCISLDGTRRGRHLGAPGPENLSSPIVRTALMPNVLIDQCVAATQSPNRVRDLTNDPSEPNDEFGTLTIRRYFVNQTGANVTRLRFRIVDITTFPAPMGTADLRALTSTDVVVAVSGACGGGTVTVRGTTLEQPPTQGNGGGYNSTLSAGTITLATPLAPNASIPVQFRLGVQQTGQFRFFVVVEVLP
ncbi:MAG TPA: lamin tail domain-containing protein [Pyrinomonadaceae bacterium]|nr:lamin tail domain-containing protein [Pyrinomonadaceae bacterium]